MIGYNIGYQKRLRDAQTSKPLVYGVRPAMTPIIPQKQCTKCGLEYPDTLEFFYKGYKRCKDCKNKTNEKYNKTEKGKQTRKRAIKKYIATDTGKQMKQDATRRYAFNYPEKQKARDAINWLVRSGQKVPATQLVCIYCEEAASQYHHPDYSKPLDVIPVCVMCHSRIHREEIVSNDYPDLRSTES